MFRPRILVVLALIAAGCSAEPASAAQIVLERIATVEDPVAITHAGDSRLFITLQPGRIVIFDGTRVLPVPFFDIVPLVSSGGERGLLSVAFHPDYKTNGFFFVNYTNLEGDTVIARYSAMSSDPNRADPSSARILLTIHQPHSNHNGGQLQFGPDGYLYIGMGDGGSAGDPQNLGQRLDSLLGKLLRIDVDREEGGLPYAIPPSNPFLNRPARPEIWAYGLRNPWRFTFDRETGDMFIADVGQNRREEINFQPAASIGGENYGWRRMEGLSCFNPSANCNDGTLVLPILDYGRDEGCSVSGGYRYRGARFGRIRGIYFYGDYCSGNIWGAKLNDDNSWSTQLLLSTSLLITTFGEDLNGELYVADHRGSVYRITETSPQERRRAARR